MASPDLSALSNAFVGGVMTFRKSLLAWKLAALGIQIRVNVNTPQALAKLSAKGGPRPYRMQEDFDDNGVKWEARTLTAFQSKWDFTLDPEEYRNTYLADTPDSPYESAAVQHVADTYLEALTKNTVWGGVRNGGGTDAVDICDGWGTILAAEITAGNVAPVATGAITNINAVAKVEQVAKAAPEFMRDNGFTIFCSYNNLDNYREDYRTRYGFTFNPDTTGQYKLNGLNATLQPAAFMGNSGRLLATYPKNMVFGCDANAIKIVTTPNLNYLKIREMMPVGCEFQDLDVIVTNDQA
jgi:hypothetical protein